MPVYRPTSQRPELPNTRPATRTTSTTTTTTSTTTTTTAAPTTPVTSGPAPRRPGVRRPPAAAVDDKPDLCNTSFDAVSIIRKDTFFFKGKYTWRLGTNGGLYPGYPALIDRLWYKLPGDMDHVDAVYERQDAKIVFFVGE